jgi:hypothetical protein
MVNAARIDVRVHEQDTDIFCGAAAIQMIVGARTGVVPDQERLFIQGSGDWAMEPASVARKLRDSLPTAPSYGAFVEPDPTRAAARVIASVEQGWPAVILNAVPSKGTSHWLVVSGAITDAGTPGRKRVLFFETRDPADFNANCVPAPHTQGDCCGSAAYSGVAAHTWCGFLALCGRSDLPKATGKHGYVVVGVPPSGKLPDVEATPCDVADGEPPTPDALPAVANAALAPLAAAGWAPWRDAVAASAFDAPTDPLSLGCEVQGKGWYLVDRELGTRVALTAILDEAGRLHSAGLMAAGSRADSILRNVRARVVGDLSLDPAFPFPQGASTAHEAPDLRPGLVWKPSPASYTPLMPFRRVRVGSRLVALRVDGRSYAAPPWGKD